MDDELACQSRNCYAHPRLSQPVEAVTPLHSQCRGQEDPDFVNFVRCCYRVGIRTPPDAMAHTLEGVGCRRIQSWMEDIMIRATSTVRRNATPEELKDAKRKRKAAERKGEALLKKKTRPGDGSTAMQLQKQLEHQNWRVSVISHLRHLFTPLKSCEENSRGNKLVS